MQFKAQLADETSPGAVILVPETIRHLIAGNCRARPNQRSALFAKPGFLRDELETGVLRDVCAIEYQEVAGVLVSLPSETHRRHASCFGLVSSLPPRLLRLLPAGAPAVGWDSHPLKNRAISQRTETNCTLSRVCDYLMTCGTIIG